MTELQAKLFCLYEYGNNNENVGDNNEDIKFEYYKRPTQIKALVM